MSSRDDVWAPDIVHHEGKFYIYSRSTTFGNFVITFPSIKGPWSEPVKLDVCEIDPGHVVGPDGKRYLHDTISTSTPGYMRIDPSSGNPISDPWAVNVALRDHLAGVFSRYR